MAARKKLAAKAPLDEYAKQAVVLDFIVAWQKAKPQKKGDFASAVLGHVLSRVKGYDAVVMAADQVFQIKMDPAVLQRYVAMLRTPAPTAAVTEFLKTVDAKPELKKQFLSSATSYEALQKVAAANGVKVSTADLRNYVEPWRVMTSLLRGMLDRKIINEQQFKKYTNFAPSETSVAGFGHDVDREIFEAVLSAAGWATRVGGLSNLKVPIAVIIFPSTAIIMGGLEGQTFTFKEIGNLFAQSFSLALEHAVNALDAFQESIGGIFR